MAQQETKALTVLDHLESRKAGIIEALPRHVAADKFLRVLKTTVTMRPEIMRATPQSVVAECMKAAADGLVLDGREATLNIYKTKIRVKKGNAFVEEWQEVAKYIPMYPGLMKRARNTGEISSWDASVVFKKDRFRFIKGEAARIEHEPSLADDPGPLTHAYSIVVFKDGSVSREVMTRAQLEAIMQRSSAYKDEWKDNKKTGKKVLTGPWKTDFEEMARKTVIRRHSKYLPVDSDLRRVIERMDDDFTFSDEASSTTKKGKSAADILNKAAATHDISETVDEETGEIVDAEFTEANDKPEQNSQPSEQEDDDLV